MAWAAAIPAVISLISAYLASQDKPKGYGLTSGDINEIIDKYRKAGLAGIQQMGEQEKANAASRIAASGLEPTLALQQSVYNPILQRLSGGRGALEGELAKTYGNLMVQRASGQQQADMAEWQGRQGMYSGIADLFGTGATYGWQSHLGQGKPFDVNQWNQNALGSGDYSRYIFGQP